MGSEKLSLLVAARAASLAYYSPYYFLRSVPAELQQHFGTGLAMQWERQADAEICSCLSESGDVHWLLQKLAWDSAYFGTATFRLFTGLFDERVTTRALAQAATKLRQQLAARQGAFYAFTIVPAEDIQILQGLTSAGWRLVETRSTYYREQLQGFEFPRYPVRTASMQEALQIGQIAAAARNPYDRVHADEWFGNARADAYLRKYAENAVLNKLATTVLVPDETALPVDSFLAIKDLEADSEVLGVRMSRVLLTAVGPLNQGWHVKLVAETVHRAQALGHDAVLMTTQATNRAVLRTCEKLGFQLGATSHVLACHNS